MKVITIDMSTECLKTPPCPFCYKNKSSNPVPVTRSRWEIQSELQNLVDKSPTWKKEPVTFCWEYNGYNLDLLGDHFSYRERGPQLHLTMTTYPEIVTPVLAGFIKSRGIEAVALSYNSSTVSSSEAYLYKVSVLKEAGLKVSCNFLLEPGFRFPPMSILRAVDQFNFLSFKPTGLVPKDKLQLVQDYITIANLIVPTATDNCLAIQLGTDTKCHRGKDFLHITADWEIVECCFKERCFIYKE